MPARGSMLHVLPDAARAGPLALEQNLALMAGAGTGKTYSLITLCLHLLGGARSGGVALRPVQLCLLTFTDKAAAELRHRLRQRLDALATGEAGEGDEPELREAFAVHGRSFPEADFWRRLRDDLGSAAIGTFHSLCVQLLRRAPAGYGVDPSFTLLEERDALALLQDTAERVVLDALERGNEEAADLCRELSFGGGATHGLADLLRQVLTKLREEGLDPAAVPVSDPEEVRAGFEQALAEVKRRCAEASALDLEAGGKQGEVIRPCAGALEGMTFDTFLEPARFPALRRAAEGIDLRRGGKAVKEALKALKYGVLGSDRDGVVGLLEHYGACRVVPHERAFRALLGELAARHREELDRRGALDFSELLIRTRDLLRDHPTARLEVQGRFGARLVDEFQDTNRLQLELVVLLAERREGTPRPVAREPRAVLTLPLEPRFLCAVGDRKQSIYEFRGADVSVLGQLARMILDEGGREGHLQTNRRSSPKLLAFFNRFFSRVMAPAAEPRDYEVVYAPRGDDLVPHRRVEEAGPAVERLTFELAEGATAEDCRAQDADAVARRIRQLLHPASGLTVERDGKTRGVVGGDVALLFRRFSFLEVYRQALIRHGVPHRVVRGRGFYGAQEVLDLAALLSLIADPADALSFAAVLRSPLVALSDAALLQVALAQGRRLSVLRLGREGLGDRRLPETEAARLARFLELYPRLRRERDRLGIRVLLQVAIEETDYRLALAGTPYGEQALANVEKLLALAARRDAAGAGDCAAFSAELRALAEADPTEAQADVLDQGDVRAVHLLTIHQSKGLEWPIVFVPDMAAAPRAASGRILFDRRLGLSVKPWVPGEDGAGRSERHQRIAKELGRREAAEHRRLLYVALTRARDRLVLSGAAPRKSAATWLGMVDGALEEDAELRALVVDVPAASLPRPAPPVTEQGSLGMEGSGRIEAVMERVYAGHEPRPAAAVFPVTTLQDYFLCPRRYLYIHQIGLAEFPSAFELPGSDDPGEGSGGGGVLLDPRARGTLAHKLLELVDHALVGSKRLDKHLEELLWAQGHSPDEQGAGEILAWVRGFLATPFARRLQAAGPERVHRELPFLLRLGGEDGQVAVHLKGQIDLLFEDEEGGATVVDYKSSLRHPEGLKAYAFQLDCYALAARRFVQEGVAVRTGIAFLREEQPGPDFREDAEAGELDALETRLVRGATELLAASRGYEWPGRERADCASLRCGFLQRCHPRP